MSKKLALFIDCDRLEAAFMTVIFDYLRNEDYDVCVKRAYVTKDNLNSWYNQLEKHYFKIILTNSLANSNLRLSADVMKILYTGDYDSIAIASNYKEFGILAGEIHAKGLCSLCFYQYSKGSEASLKRAYNTIYNLEPNQERSQTFDLNDADNMLDIFESALEGLDSKILEETLTAGHDEKQKTKSKRTKAKSRIRTTENVKTQ